MNEIMALILNYNSCGLTTKCVNKLLDISEDLKILVVDNCSTDNSYEKLSAYFLKDGQRVEIIKTDANLGYANGNNFGMKYIKGHYESIKYVMIMNPDITISKMETVVELKEFLKRNEDYAIVSCQILFNDMWRGFLDYGWKFPSCWNLLWSGTFLGKLFVKNINDRYSEVEIMKSGFSTQVDVVAGCFFMARLSDLEKVGYMDERTFLYYEETILAKRLRTIGKGEAILLNHFVYHNHQEKDASIRNFRKRLFDRKCFYDSKMIYIKYYSQLSRSQITICEVANSIDSNLKKLVYGMAARIQSGGKNVC